MKLSQKQQIIEHAKAHPEGFKAADLAYTGIKPNQIARKLWEMKKKKILTHNTKKHTYSLTVVNKTKPTQPKTQAKPTRETDYYRRLFDSLSDMHEKLEAKHEDALAIIRYLENKLLIAIQHDARR